MALMMRFDSPFMPGYEHYTEQLVKDDEVNMKLADCVKLGPLYVACALVKPGKQYYLINKNELEENE
jgi:hypothetical protein